MQIVKYSSKNKPKIPFLDEILEDGEEYVIYPLGFCKKETYLKSIKSFAKLKEQLDRDTQYLREMKGIEKMELTTNDLYKIIKQKKENTEKVKKDKHMQWLKLDHSRFEVVADFLKEDRLKLEGKIEAYEDVINLIESSGELNGK